MSDRTVSILMTLLIAVVAVAIISAGMAVWASICHCSVP